MNSKKMAVEELHDVIRKDPKAVVIDVREAVEHRGGSVPGAANKPLSSIQNWMPAVSKDKTVYLVCKSGGRAAQAAEKLAAAGVDTCVVTGGIEEWKRKNLPFTEASTKVWELERQVRLTAGLLVASGILLSWWVHPAFSFLSLFVGCGLVFAAVTNTCGMGLMLASCPWNRK